MQIDNIEITGYAILAGGIKIPPHVVSVTAGEVDVRCKANVVLAATEAATISLIGEQWDRVFLSIPPGGASITLTSPAITLHAGDVAQLLCVSEEGRTWASIAQ
jgi:hypothetical protein